MIFWILPLTALQLLVTKKHQLSYNVKSSEFWHFGFPRFNRPNEPFLGVILIFLSLPHVCWLRKIEKPWKKCIVWLDEVGKVTYIFFRILSSKFWNILKISKKFWWPKNPETIQKRFIFDFTFWLDPKKTIFWPKKVTPLKWGTVNVPRKVTAQ